MTAGNGFARGQLHQRLQSEGDKSELERMRAAFKMLAHEAKRTLLFEGAPAQLEDLRNVMESDEIKEFYDG